LANLAIHPENKVPIVQQGGLTQLILLAESNQSPLVLQQIARCLFSLAAHRSNRPIMCEQGALEVVRNMLGYVCYFVRKGLDRKLTYETE